MNKYTNLIKNIFKRKDRETKSQNADKLKNKKQSVELKDNGDSSPAKYRRGYADQNTQEYRDKVFKHKKARRKIANKSKAINRNT